MRYTLAVAMLLCAGVLEAQETALLGTWQVSYQAGLTRQNGIDTPIIATGTLTIQVEGDSLVGTLVTDPSADIPQRPPARLAAARTPGAPFVSRTKAVINVNGNEREATAISTWKLSATGDALSGTIERTLEDLAGAAVPASNVTGTRKKS